MDITGVSVNILIRINDLSTEDWRKLVNPSGQIVPWRDPLASDGVAV